MTDPNWQPLQKMDIPANPEGLWTKVLDFITGPRKLRFTAKGSWQLTPGRSCGADGSRAAGSPASAFLPSAPLGALIGKIGGSSADAPPPPAPGVVVPAVPVSGGPLVIAVGSFCTLEIQATTKGPLFVTMNDQLAGFDLHSGTLELTIDEAL